MQMQPIFYIAEFKEFKMTAVEDYGRRVESYDANGDKTVSDTRDLVKFRAFKIAEMKELLNKELSKTDWYVIRNTERGNDIPQSVTDERAALILACSTAEDSMNSASTVLELDLINLII